MEKIPMDNCEWCKGSGREDGHLPCPDCEGTGYKYGKRAEASMDALLDIMDEWHDTLTAILVEDFGFPEKRFIPKDAVTFVMNYFRNEEKMPPKAEVRTFMLEELEAGFFLKFRPTCYGQKCADGSLRIYTSLMSPPPPVDEDKNVLRGRPSISCDFYVTADDAPSFLRHTDAIQLGNGVFSFSKETWKTFPNSITLHEQHSLYAF